MASRQWSFEVGLECFYDPTKFWSKWNKNKTVKSLSKRLEEEQSLPLTSKFAWISAFASGAGTARLARSRTLILLAPSTALTLLARPLCLQRKNVYQLLAYGQTGERKEEVKKKPANLLASSSLNFTSISLLGGYFGKLDGSQAYGSVIKNCKQETKYFTNYFILSIYDNAKDIDHSSPWNPEQS